MFSRILAWSALCFAVSVLGAELLIYLESGVYAPLTLGQIWQSLAQPSYIATEELIRGRLSPPLWDAGFARLLAVPAWLVLGGFAVLFFLIAAGKRR